MHRIASSGFTSIPLVAGAADKLFHSIIEDPIDRRQLASWYPSLHLKTTGAIPYFDHYLCRNQRTAAMSVALGRHFAV